MRQMCKCENVRCPFHMGRQCDLPAAAKLRWQGALTGMCQQCLKMATQTHPQHIDAIEPITAAAQSGPSPKIPAYYETHMPRTARLLKKGAATGNETFDRIWSDFHGKLSAPENEDREFHEVFGDHDSKHQLIVALGKLNYMMEEGNGFEDWIAEGYAASTGDLLLKKLPAHTHVYPLLSKLHSMIEELLETYADFGVTSFVDLERLLTSGPSRDTLWAWFKAKKKGMFRFRGRVTEPYDLESISGKWGSFRLDDEPLTQALVDGYEAELAETEAELVKLPVDGVEEGKTIKAKRADLLELQAELDSMLEALHYRMTLQKAWKEFKADGWASPADEVLNALNARYHELITLNTLVTEASELFNATPDEVYPIEQAGEEQAQSGESEILNYLDA